MNTLVQPILNNNFVNESIHFPIGAHTPI